MTDKKNIDSDEEKELQEEQIESEINSNSKTEAENEEVSEPLNEQSEFCLLYTSPSPRDDR